MHCLYELVRFRLPMLTKYDIGKLKRGMRVKVGDKLGTVCDPHEPTWIDHRTRAFMHVLQGADITFDGDAHGTYIHCANIEILANNRMDHAEK